MRFRVQINEKNLVMQTFASMFYNMNGYLEFCIKYASVAFLTEP